VAGLVWSMALVPALRSALASKGVEDLCEHPLERRMDGHGLAASSTPAYKQDVSVVRLLDPRDVEWMATERTDKEDGEATAWHDYTPPTFCQNSARLAVAR
jgi:hypothetical protein